MYQINAIGCEIECELASSIQDNLSSLAGVDIVGDGSVYRCTIREHARNSRGGNATNYPDEEAFLVDHRASLPTAEIRVGPFVSTTDFMPVFNVLNRLRSDRQWHYNGTGGFHVHVSFKTADKSNVMPPEIWSSQFYRFFIGRVSKVFPDVIKKRGKNGYCKVETPEDQSLDEYLTHPDRYQAINYHAFNKHGTVEIRLWPSDEPDKMREYLEFTVATMQEWLSKVEQDGITTSARFEVPEKIAPLSKSYSERTRELGKDGYDQEDIDISVPIDPTVFYSGDGTVGLTSAALHRALERVRIINQWHAYPPANIEVVDRVRRKNVGDNLARHYPRIKVHRSIARYTKKPVQPVPTTKKTLIKNTIKSRKLR